MLADLWRALRDRLTARVAGIPVWLLWFDLQAVADVIGGGFAVAVSWCSSVAILGPAVAEVVRGRAELRTALRAQRDHSAGAWDVPADDVIGGAA